MEINHRTWYIRGIRDGIPIALGYLAVSFSLGIAAGNMGMKAFSAALMSFTNVTSAGEFAGLSLMAAGAAYMEMAGTQFIINLRYCLMSCALSQKLSPKMPFFHRFLMAYGITDEIFGIAIGAGAGQALSPYYVYGAISVAVPGWTLGTWLGVVSGNILPARVLSALNVALYGMFIAIIIPASKANRVVGGVVAASFLISFTVSKIPLFDHMSDSMKISLLTVIIAGVAAYLFPAKDEEEGEECIADAPDTTKEVR